MVDIIPAKSHPVVANISTDGKGFWSRRVAQVTITGVQLRPYSATFGELRVYFNTETWNPETDGLIYTDKTFLAELKDFLTAQGLDCSDLDYSEQGMQGDDYVSLDTGAKFNESYFKLFG